jgi:hypothetical protein
MVGFLGLLFNTDEGGNMLILIADELLSDYKR